jgi:YHS domain-containing protein
MRIILYLLVLIIVLPTLLRFVLSLVKALLGPSQREVRSRAANVPLQGELKRDPVCGTYVSTATSVKKTVGGEVVHFCSEECRGKYRG